jgi:hypothetical protein
MMTAVSALTNCPVDCADKWTDIEGCDEMNAGTVDEAWMVDGCADVVLA